MKRTTGLGHTNFARSGAVREDRVRTRIQPEEKPKSIDNQTESINLPMDVRTPRAVHLAKSGVHAGERARAEPTRTRRQRQSRTGWAGRRHRTMRRDPPVVHLLEDRGRLVERPQALADARWSESGERLRAAMRLWMRASERREPPCDRSAAASADGFERALGLQSLTRAKGGTGREGCPCWRRTSEMIADRAPREPRW